MKFRGQYAFLSNFHAAPTMYDGVLYPTSEHAYMAAKTLNLRERQQVLTCGTPSEAKKMGRRLQLRPDWEQVKVPIMGTILMDKFTRNPDLRKMLKATGNLELVEENTWGDVFWGRCNGQGQNMLGRLLMLVRARI